MKFTVPGIVLMAFIVASPLAFAENSDYWNTTLQPGARVAKDDQSNVTKLKKHMATYKQRHHTKHMSSKPQTTGTGSSSKSEKDDTTPKSK